MLALHHCFTALGESPWGVGAVEGGAGPVECRLAAEAAALGVARLQVTVARLQPSAPSVSYCTASLTIALGTMSRKSFNSILYSIALLDC